jgi:hypothetical protein
MTLGVEPYDVALLLTYADFRRVSAMSIQSHEGQTIVFFMGTATMKTHPHILMSPPAYLWPLGGQSSHYISIYLLVGV